MPGWQNVQAVHHINFDTFCHHGDKTCWGGNFCCNKALRREREMVALLCPRWRAVWHRTAGTAGRKADEIATADPDSEKSAHASILEGPSSRQKHSLSRRLTALPCCSIWRAQAASVQKMRHFLAQDMHCSASGTLVESVVIGSAWFCYWLLAQCLQTEHWDSLVQWDRVNQPVTLHKALCSASRFQRTTHVFTAIAVTRRELFSFVYWWQAAYGFASSVAVSGALIVSRTLQCNNAGSVSLFMQVSKN